MKKKALIIDPDPRTLDFLREKLDASNLTAEIALGGTQGLAAIRTGKYDLIISAMEIPHPHGMEIIKELRSQGLRIPVLFLTRLFTENPDTQKKSPELEPYEILEKPLFINSLYEHIETHLKMKIHWKERRREERVPLFLDILFTLNENDQIRATTLDLSLGGVCIERKMCELCATLEEDGFHPECLFSPESQNGNTPVDLKITLPNGNPMELTGKIAHTLLQKDKAREIIGIEFSRLEEHQKATLTRILRENRY